DLSRQLDFKADYGAATTSQPCRPCCVTSEMKTARDIYRSGRREPEENLRRDRQTRAQSPPKEWR
ncbi:MAG: hypothetical protein RR412_12055, partial [Burkholderiaceae bacterium]